MSLNKVPIVKKKKFFCGQITRLKELGLQKCSVNPFEGFPPPPGRLRWKNEEFTFVMHVVDELPSVQPYFGDSQDIATDGGRDAAGKRVRRIGPKYVGDTRTGYHFQYATAHPRLFSVRLFNMKKTNNEKNHG